MVDSCMLLAKDCLTSMVSLKDVAYVGLSKRECSLLCAYTRKDELSVRYSVSISFNCP